MEKINLKNRTVYRINWATSWRAQSVLQRVDNQHQPCTGLRETDRLRIVTRYLFSAGFRHLGFVALFFFLCFFFSGPFLTGLQWRDVLEVNREMYIIPANNTFCTCDFFIQSCRRRVCMFYSLCAILGEPSSFFQCVCFLWQLQPMEVILVRFFSFFFCGSWKQKLKKNNWKY